MSYSTSQDQSTMSSEMAQSEPKMQSQASAIPDLVKIGAIPTNTAIEVDTDILDPVVRSDTFCRFQFQNKGILHSHSKISVRLAASNDQGEAFGLERVQAVIETYGRESAEYITWKLRKSVQEWIGSESPNEDLTLVAVKLL